jgi:hypothetical protein
MKDRFTPRTLIFLDDADTAVGSRVLNHWCKSWGASVELVGNSGGAYAVVKIG